VVICLGAAFGVQARPDVGGRVGKIVDGVGKKAGDEMTIAKCKKNWDESQMLGRGVLVGLRASPKKGMAGSDN